MSGRTVAFSVLSQIVVIAYFGIRIVCMLLQLALSPCCAESRPTPDDIRWSFYQLSSIHRAFLTIHNKIHGSFPRLS